MDRVQLVTTSQLQDVYELVNRTNSWDSINWNKYPTVPGDGHKMVKIKNSTGISKYIFDAQRTGADSSECDAHILCEDGFVPCHRLLLMEFSPLLKELIIENMKVIGNPSHHNIVSIALKDFKLKNVLEVLLLFYTGFSIFPAENLKTVLALLEFLKVKNDALPVVPTTAQIKNKKTLKRFEDMSDDSDDDNKNEEKRKKSHPSRTTDKVQTLTRGTASTDRKNSKIDKLKQNLIVKPVFRKVPAGSLTNRLPLLRLTRTKSNARGRKSPPKKIEKVPSPSTSTMQMEGNDDDHSSKCSAEDISSSDSESSKANSDVSNLEEPVKRRMNLRHQKRCESEEEDERSLAERVKTQSRYSLRKRPVKRMDSSDSVKPILTRPKLKPVTTTKRDDIIEQDDILEQEDILEVNTSIYGDERLPVGNPTVIVEKLSDARIQKIVATVYKGGTLNIPRLPGYHYVKAMVTPNSDLYPDETQEEIIARLRILEREQEESQREHAERRRLKAQKILPVKSKESQVDGFQALTNTVIPPVKQRQEKPHNESQKEKTQVAPPLRLNKSSLLDEEEILSNSQDIFEKLTVCSCGKTHATLSLATKCLSSHGYKRCWICCELLAVGSPLDDHYRTCHFESLGVPGEVACPICKVPNKYSGLGKHISSKHLHNLARFKPRSAKVPLSGDEHVPIDDNTTDPASIGLNQPNENVLLNGDEVTSNHNSKQPTRLSGRKRKSTPKVVETLTMLDQNLEESETSNTPGTSLMETTSKNNTISSENRKLVGKKSRRKTKPRAKLEKSKMAVASVPTAAADTLSNTLATGKLGVVRKRPGAKMTGGKLKKTKMDMPATDALNQISETNINILDSESKAKKLSNSLAKCLQVANAINAHLRKRNGNVPTPPSQVIIPAAESQNQVNNSSKIPSTTIVPVPAITELSATAVLPESTTLAAVESSVTTVPRELTVAAVTDFNLLAGTTAPPESPVTNEIKTRDIIITSTRTLEDSTTELQSRLSESTTTAEPTTDTEQNSDQSFRENIILDFDTSLLSTSETTAAPPEPLNSVSTLVPTASRVATPSTTLPTLASTNLAPNISIEQQERQVLQGATKNGTLAPLDSTNTRINGPGPSSALLNTFSGPVHSQALALPFRHPQPHSAVLSTALMQGLSEIQFPRTPLPPVSSTVMEAGGREYCGQALVNGQTFTVYRRTQTTAPHPNAYLSLTGSEDSIGQIISPSGSSNQSVALRAILPPSTSSIPSPLQRPNLVQNTRMPGPGFIPRMPTQLIRQPQITQMNAFPASQSHAPTVQQPPRRTGQSSPPDVKPHLRLGPNGQMIAVSCNTLNRPTNVTPANVHVCPTCNRHFSSKATLDSHFCS